MLHDVGGTGQRFVYVCDLDPKIKDQIMYF